LTGEYLPVTVKGADGRTTASAEVAAMM